MAKFVDKTSRNLNQKTIEQRRNILASVLTLTAGLFSALGFLLGEVLRKNPLWAHALAFVAITVTLRMVFVWARRRIEGLTAAQSGAFEPLQPGPSLNLTLQHLPDDFLVVNGLTGPLGDAEYLVVGSTGIFILDSLGWKGEVTVDSHGELLWNGHPPDVPLIQEMKEKALRIQEMLTDHTGSKIQIQPVLVFTAAQLDAGLNRTNPVYCVAREQLCRHLVKGQLGMHLKKREIEDITRAFVTLDDVT